MVKAKVWVVAAAMVLVACGAMASNFRVADQVYIPIAGHIQGGASLFVSDVFISNLSTDSVSVSLIYGPQNGKGAFQPFADRITLAPNERKEFVDFFPTVLPELTNPFGILVFNACKQGQSCKPDPNNNFTNPNFRPISVESRIYAVNVGSDPKTAPTNGQDMPGIPWYNFVSSSESGAGLSTVFITGFRNNANYRSNLGVLNASEFSSTTITATLHDGATGNVVGTPHVYNLPPLTFEQSNISAVFNLPAATNPPTTNMWVDFVQNSSSPVVGGDNDAAANGCGTDGCPAYLAYGSVLDNQTNDPTTLEAQYKQSLTDAQIGCIYNPDLFTCASKAGGKSIRRVVNH